MTFPPRRPFSARLISWLYPHVLAVRNRMLHRLGGKSVGVRALVQDGDGRVLLIRHTYIPGWHMPGGGVCAGESTIDAVIREVREEAGLTVTAPPQLCGVYHGWWKGMPDYTVLYRIPEFTGEAHAADAVEIAEAGWFALDALPMDTSPKTRERLREVLGS
jgi:8-oxo-dGTP pyrophosphatase MutT (NUDIX family)